MKELFSQATVSSFLSHSPRRHQSLALWHVRLRLRRAFCTHIDEPTNVKNSNQKMKKKSDLPSEDILEAAKHTQVRR
jgi:hypothetical protein